MNALLLLLSQSVAFQVNSDYESLMRQYDPLVKESRFAEAEAVLNQAVRIRYTNDALGKLAWVIGRLGRLEESQSLCEQAYHDFGPTPYNCTQYVEAALNTGDIQLADKVLKEAYRRNYHSQNNWIGSNLRNYSVQIQNSSKASTFDLTWTIPFKDFLNSKPIKLVLPQEKSDFQEFQFEIKGAASVVNDALASAEYGGKVVIVTPNPDSDVKINAIAHLWPRVNKISDMRSMQIRSRSEKDALILFYYNTEMKANSPLCHDIAKSVKRNNWYESTSATLKWMIENIAYAEPNANDLETVLGSRKGVCRHTSYLFMSLMSINGYHSEIRGGYILPEGEEQFIKQSTHQWVAVRTSDGKSIEFDPRVPSTLVNFYDRSHYLQVNHPIEDAPIRPAKEFPTEIRSLRQWPVSGKKRL